MHNYKFSTDTRRRQAFFVRRTIFKEKCWLLDKNKRILYAYKVS